MTKQSRISRRRFLQATTALTTAGITTLSPAAYAGILGANDRLNVGVIGVGAMGSRHLDGLLHRQTHLNIDVLQTCDVYRKRAESAAQRQVGNRCKPTQRYEEVLENPHIDAVFVATPDHWHAKIAMDAVQSGKHVYLEPPLGHTVEQALELLRVVQARQDRVRVQVGAPSTSFELCDQVRAYIQEQGFGKLLLVNSSDSGQRPPSGCGAWETIVSPRLAGLDWDRWLGHGYTCAGQPLARRRAWDPERYFQFNRYSDYSGGIGTDHFINRLSFLLKATGLSYPEHAVAAGGTWVKALPVGRCEGLKGGDVPDFYNTILEYADGVTVTLIGSACNATPVPTRLVGQAAVITLNDPEHPTIAEIRPPSTATKHTKPLVVTGKAGGDEEHRENFIRACRDPRIELCCPVRLALRVNVALAMSRGAYQDQKVYSWDRQAQQMLAG
jgi:predicted dehydrogenase